MLCGLTIAKGGLKLESGKVSNQELEVKELSDFKVRPGHWFPAIQVHGKKTKLVLDYMVWCAIA